MLFHMFNSQEERRNFGGSAFIEIQHCKLPESTKLEKIISVKEVSHWENDSLYVSGDDMNLFYEQYKDIITGGVYNNGKSGNMDLYGINFYSREKADLIIKRIEDEKPQEYEILLRWLKSGTDYIGFYVLGV